MPSVSRIELHSTETSQSGNNYDGFQDRYMQLGGQPEKLKKLRGQIEKKFGEDPNKPMVHLSDIRQGVKKYAVLLKSSQYKPSLEELNRKQKLMKFNLKQLELDKDKPDYEKSQKAFTELHDLISKRISNYGTAN